MAVTINGTTGIETNTDTGKIKVGASDDLEIFHQSGNNFIKNTVAGQHLKIKDAEGDDMAIFNQGGAVELYHNGTVRLATNANGVEVNGHVWLGDGEHVKFGGGTNGDLQIYHDGSNGYIKGNGAACGGIIIDNEADTDQNIEIKAGQDVYLKVGSETGLRCEKGGATYAYYDDSIKLQTQSAGLKWYGSGSGNGSLTYINDVAGDDKHSEYRFERTSRSTNLCSLIYIGENGSSQGEVMVYGSAANSNISGGVRVVDGATSWSAISDMRLKDKTGDITNALTDIAKIEPIKFTWKADTNKKPQVGVSAQSVENVVPEAVAKSKDPVFEKNGDDTEYLTVKYTELIPLCIAAIKEAKTKIETLETEKTKLQTDLTALTARVAALEAA